MARILVVDNDQTWLDLISKSLPAYDVVVADTYDSALGALRRGSYDAAVVDLNLADSPELPIEDRLGAEILKLLRSDYPETCRIALTAYPPGAVMAFVREYDVADLLLKQNMTLSVVREVVQAALEGKSAELPPGVRGGKSGAQDDFDRWRRDRIWAFDQQLRTQRNDLNSPPRGLSEATADEHRAALRQQIRALERKRDEFERECSGVQAMLDDISTPEWVSATQDRIDGLKQRFGSGGNTNV